MSKKQTEKHIINILGIIIGAFIMGISYNTFYASQGFVLSGFSGIAILIKNGLALININLSVSLIYLFLNVILFIFAFKVLGKTFTIYALIGIISYTFFLDFADFFSIGDSANDLLLCCIYGGVFTGLGTGLVLKMGGSTGGGDLLGCIINSKNNKISIGTIMLSVNLVVLILSIIFYGLDKGLYSGIAVYLCGMISDIIVEGSRSVSAYYIISQKSDEMANAIMFHLKKGVTAFDAVGMYTNVESRVLLCLVYKHQIYDLQRIIYSIDKNAFVFSTKVSESMGRGFTKLNPKKPLIQKILHEDDNE